MNRKSNVFCGETTSAMSQLRRSSEWAGQYVKCRQTLRGQNATNLEEP